MKRSDVWMLVQRTDWGQISQRASGWAACLWCVRHSVSCWRPAARHWICWWTLSCSCCSCVCQLMPVTTSALVLRYRSAASPICSLSQFQRPFSRWTWVSRYQNVDILDFIKAKDDGGGSENWSYKTCKAAVKLSPPINQHPVFLQAGCPSCRPTNSVKALKGKISHSVDLLTPSSPGGLPTLSLTTNSSWLPWGGLPCLSSALWCQYPSVSAYNITEKVVGDKLGKDLELDSPIHGVLCGATASFATCWHLLT